MASKSTNPEQEPRRERGSNKCVTHKKKKLTFWCVDCERLICATCVTLVDHRGHTLREFSDIITDKKENIQNFIDRVEKHDLFEFQKVLRSTVAKLEDNSQTFETISTEILVQTKKCKDELDRLAQEFLSELKTITTDNESLLNNHKTELENRVAELKMRIQACSETLLSGSGIQIYDIESDIQDSPSFPDTPVLHTARFNACVSFSDHLRDALGELTTSLDRDQAQIHFEDGTNPDSSIKQEVPSTVPSTSSDGQSTTSSHSYRLLDTPIPMSEFTLPCNITSICPTTSAEAWTCDKYSRTVTLLDKEGHIKRQIECDNLVRDIGLSPTTQNLWLCTADYNNIMELDTSVYKLTKRFSTDFPWSIYVTNTGHVVVGTPNEVTVYTTKGHSVHTTNTQMSGVICPVRTTQCPFTGNIAVLDSDYSGLGGKDKPNIMILDNKLSLLYRFTGEGIQTARGHLFDRRDITYDSKGNLVIVDGTNNTVELVSGTGQYIRTLQTNRMFIQAVGIDSDDVLWVVFADVGSNLVKLFQYYE